jgi:hypothetical protein
VNSARPVGHCDACSVVDEQSDGQYSDSLEGDIAAKVSSEQTMIVLKGFKKRWNEYQRDLQTRTSNSFDKC